MPPTPNDVFSVGDKGVWRGTWQATQRKPWEGIPASGRKVKWTVMIMGRFEGDKLAELRAFVIRPTIPE